MDQHIRNCCHRKVHRCRLLPPASCTASSTFDGGSPARAEPSGGPGCRTDSHAREPPTTRQTPACGAPSRHRTLSDAKGMREPRRTSEVTTSSWAPRRSSGCRGGATPSDRPG
jgi:hypothetical protein